MKEAIPFGSVRVRISDIMDEQGVCPDLVEWRGEAGGPFVTEINRSALEVRCTNNLYWVGYISGRASTDPADNAQDVMAALLEKVAFL